MRRSPLIVLVLLFSITQSGVAEAGYSLKINFTQNARAYELRELRSAIFPVGTAEALIEKTKMYAYAKNNKNQITKMIADICKKHYFFNSRIKIKDARGGTAGLGNLKTLKVENIKVSEDFPNYDLNMTDEEVAKIEEEYPDITSWPGWIEEGYVLYSINGVCKFSSSVSIISSVAYEVFIKEDLYGEYSRSELIKKKWILNYKSPD
jgi:hypothetical protein